MPVMGFRDGKDSEMPKENINDVVVGWDHLDVQIATTSGDESDGHFLTVGRDSINRLIKTLRRARDYAYGADQ